MRIFFYLIIILRSLDGFAQLPNVETDFLSQSPPQKTYRRYQTNFSFQHDRGLYVSAQLGPAWTHSLNNPKVYAVRFNGKFAFGGYINNGLALSGAVWGQFMESATNISVGPNLSFLFNSINMAVDFSLGLGRAFNIINDSSQPKFSEMVLASSFTVSKYWWLSKDTCLGVSFLSAIYGFTLSSVSINTVGYSAGLSLAFLLG